MKKRIAAVLAVLIGIGLAVALIVVININSGQYLTITFVDGEQNWFGSGLIIITYGKNNDTKVLPFVNGHVQFYTKEKKLGLAILNDGKLYSCWRIEFVENPKLPNQIKTGNETLYVDIKKSCKLEP